MKVLILAGGLGTRLSEETEIRPKPMVEIGGKPILWHIMKLYSSFGFNQFIILLGYKGEIIKEYFHNHLANDEDYAINFHSDLKVSNEKSTMNWNVNLLDTGLNTQTGGRIRRAKKFINNEQFLLTYGDGISNININDSVEFHNYNQKKITMSAVQPEGRYGAIKMNSDNLVESFVEKPKGDGTWINGGFFVCEPSVIDEIKNDDTVFENEPLESLVQQRELIAMKHHGYWGCMDTLRDKKVLNNLWNDGKAPWKIW